MRSFLFTVLLVGGCQVQEQRAAPAPVPAVALPGSVSIHYELVDDGDRKRVVITAPPEAVALATSDKLATIDLLVDQLTDPERAWAAEVILAAITGHDDFLAKGFTREQYQSNFLASADKRWRRWLERNRAKLEWDATAKRFRVRQA